MGKVFLKEKQRNNKYKIKDSYLEEEGRGNVIQW